MDGRTDLCLIGEGVDGSVVRAMQEAALRAVGRSGSYEVIDTGPGGLPAVLNDLRSGRWRGANVAAPYKFALASACDELEGDALRTGAINTITVDAEGRLWGGNTEAAAFEMALSGRNLWPVEESRAVVLGSGGAAAAAVLALTRVPVSWTTLVARRIDAARRLLDALAARGDVGEVGVALWDEDYLARPLGNADIVVNATSAGLDDLPFSVSRLRASCTVADVRHRPRPVDLVAAAAAAGLSACDGLDMLLHQAMLSFRRWTAEEPPYAAAQSALGMALDG